MHRKPVIERALELAEAETFAFRVKCERLSSEKVTPSPKSMD